MSRLLTWLLLPLSWLYAAVLAVRNKLYDWGWKASESFDVPLLNVGNLRVGGTGKTPHVAWLVAELLRLGHRPAILSRGYGRQTRGPRLATPKDSAATVGDEPWQYYQQFAAAGVPIAVAEARRLGLLLLRQQQPEVSVVVLDDAYQHRAVRPTLNILLTELARPFYADYVLPAGRLRESRAGAARADVVVVTKCLPGLDEATRQAVTQRIRAYSTAPVLFSAYAYGEARALTPGPAPCPPPPATALLLTGIAQPGPLRDYLESLGYTIAFHADFPDHHRFQPSDFEALRRHWQPGRVIFTTEKDATRLQAPALAAVLTDLPLYIIPVQAALLGDGAEQLRRRLPPPPAPQP
ncbi:tetraacyldisaccharide 4'-kinase [Hymenobacter saemangeumensis]|uniref:Tetraacyldisaccharide 4'-kinase n=1 Tax=Hymenobacter saemangeumensis TaxID=1084522 RepID=A0ABP8IFN0_9BACT